MKPLVLLIVVFCLSVKTIAQTNQNFDRSGPIPWLMQDDMTARVEDFVSNNKNLVGKDKNIEGSVFLHDHWNKGYIKLADDKVAGNLLLRYNVYADKIYFLNDSVELVLQNYACEFGYAYSSENGEIKQNCFKNGYPAIDNNTGATFYEILVNGTIRLLKKHSKRIKQKLTGTGVQAYRIDDAASWYAYSPKKNVIVKIRKDPHSLEGLFDPASIQHINEIINSKKIRLTTEKKLVEFFEILNREGI
jgi:hypothetical protein